MVVTDEPVDVGGPDAATHLARQLVAAKLNLAQGSDPFIQPAVDDADVFLELFPAGSDPRGEDRQLADDIKAELDAYNNLDCGDDDSDSDSGDSDSDGGDSDSGDSDSDGGDSDSDGGDSDSM